ncbi:snare-like protein [Gonapodya prolifera JEL478]|uniref:Snare-like protein n=1 Tax=Gonapodya prolifera (strain JEL478) TaxID=1344416 RepID=A0A139AEB9_GONPJ|nr:snare-like protein [Gonapodya prolifera JEL478]|eukprot:KXS15117.1 snare-like protein [Gonapodya prolifera JEL478]
MHWCQRTSSRGKVQIFFWSCVDDRSFTQHYATLYFVFLADSSESQLGVLDLIQVLVESLDRVFENVCELDVVFRPDEVRHVLNEVVAGGMVLETNLTEIVGVIKEMNKKAGVVGRSSDVRW